MSVPLQQLFQKLTQQSPQTQGGSTAAAPTAPAQTQPQMQTQTQPDDNGSDAAPAAPSPAEPDTAPAATTEPPPPVSSAKTGYVTPFIDEPEPASEAAPATAAKPAAEPKRAAAPESAVEPESSAEPEPIAAPEPTTEPASVAEPIPAAESAPVAEPEPAPATPSPLPQEPAGAERMGERCMRAGLLTAEQVQRIVELQRTHHLRFGQAAVQLGFLSDAVVQRVLAEQYRYATLPAAGHAASLALPIAQSPFSPEAEAIRQLRSELSILLAGQTPISIAVVSPGEKEGKTYLAMSLAIAFAQTGRRTLLINANLRPSGQHADLLGPVQTLGLSSFLAGRMALPQGRPVPGFPALHVLDAGPTPPNPLELLREPTLEQLMDTLSKDFDTFIVDTPGATRSADAQTIARQCDTCVMVARKDVTPLAELEHSQRLLQTANVRLLGVVYNEFDPQRKTGAQPRGLLGRLRRWFGP